MYFITDEAISVRASFLLLILLQDIGRENSSVFKMFPSTVLNCSELFPKRQKQLELAYST